MVGGPWWSIEVTHHHESEIMFSVLFSVLPRLPTGTSTSGYRYSSVVLVFSGLDSLTHDVAEEKVKPLTSTVLAGGVQKLAQS